MTATDAVPTAAPSPPAVVFLLLLAIVPTALAYQLLNADGDIARHLRHGAWILEHGDVIRADPFSWTRPGAPFVGFEFGAQVLMALAERAAGLTGVVLLAAVLIAAAFAELCRILLREGVDALLALLGTLGAALVSAFFWVARPHLFTQLFVVVLLGLLLQDARTPGRPRFHAAVALLFAVWANVHGGWIFGLVLMGIVAAGRWLDAGGSFMARMRAPGVRSVLLAMALGALVTVATPYGLALPRHVVDFFRLDYTLRVTREFQAPNFRLVQLRFFLVALLAAVAVLARARRPMPWASLLPCLALTAFALQAMRNIALFAIVAVPLLVIFADEQWRAATARLALRDTVRATASGRTWPWALGGTLAMGALVTLSPAALRRELVQAEFSPARFPVRAVQRMREEGDTGRLFHEFTWGGYLLHALPAQRVFIDGGSDFYGDALMEEYMQLWTLQDGWRDRLRSRDVDLALLPPHSPLALQLAREPGWTTRFSDSTAVLLQRTTP